MLPNSKPFVVGVFGQEHRMISRIRLAMIVVAAFTGTLSAQEAKPTPASSLQRLKDGNDRFAADKPAKRDVGKERRAELAKGQHPFAVVLTCADSRVAPELLFDTGLGDLFVLRVAGNIADPAVIVSVGYAVEHLHVPLIVVLGHESCGAVSIALEGKPLPDDVSWLVKRIKVGDNLPADKDARLAAGVRNNVAGAVADLLKGSKVIEEEFKQKKVAIVSGVYSLKTGKIEWTPPAEKKEPAPEKPKAPGAAAPVEQPPMVVGPARYPRLRAIFGRNR
jgi:carbonic anhydrase